MALIYDSSVELRVLMNGSMSLASCLSGLGRDLQVRWYSATRKAQLANPSYRRIAMTGDGETITGDASEDLLSAKVLSSFGGSAACNAAEVQLREHELAPPIVCSSVSQPDSLAKLLPKYEANPKHRREAYFRDGGEYVAPMTVGDDSAQKELYASVPDGQGAFFGFTEGKLLKFVLTGGRTYHAYEVTEWEVPAVVLSALKKR